MTGAHVPADTPGLHAIRAGLGPTTLTAPGPGYVVVRTPSRPDFLDGNALHVEEAVDVTSLDHWLRAFDERLRHLPDIAHQELCWETDLSLPDAGAYTDRLAAAAAERGLELARLTLMELGEAVRPMVPLTQGVQVVRATDEKHWFGVRGLHVSDEPGTPGAFWTWRMEQYAELARTGRGASWVAYRFGIPAATASVLAADGSGVASVESVITHPVHRRLGLASHLVAVAAATHRREHPGDRIALLADHGSDAERMYARLGFRPTGTVWIALRRPPAGR